MSDLIDRQAAIDVIDYWHGIDASEALSRLPSAQPTIDPVKHGKWIEYPEVLSFTDALDDTYIGCSECRNVFNILDNDTERFNYCPNCGARMNAQIGEDKSHPFAESVMMGMDGEE